MTPFAQQRHLSYTNTGGIELISTWLVSTELTGSPGKLVYRNTHSIILEDPQGRTHQGGTHHALCAIGSPYNHKPLKSGCAWRRRELSAFDRSARNSK